MLALSKDDDRVPPRDRGEARQNSPGRPRSGAVAGNGIPATAHSLAVERDRLVKKLDSIGSLTDEERAALRELPLDVRMLGDGEDIVRDGDRPSKCCLVLDGFVCRYKLLQDGKRQILSFHTPGDIPDLQSLHLRTMDHSIGALAVSRVGFIAHQDLRALIGQFPDLGNLFWRDTLIDAAIFREWMVGLGRRNAHQRIAHLLCEMALRFEGVGLAQDHTFPMPVTQAELADALGLTLVHVNRVLRDLRLMELVRMESRTVSVLNWDRLVALGEFDPTYLHQD
jgi:CRP-like cAMP-binding protein